jgi:hypothetical protein
MSVTHHADTRNAIADAVLAAIDTGAGNATLELRTSGDVEVATLTCSDPAGTVTGAVLTFSAITDDSSATGGTAAKFAIISPTPTECVYGSVGTSGEDINLSSVVIGAGDTVSISSLTYTAPV